MFKNKDIVFLGVGTDDTFILCKVWNQSLRSFKVNNNYFWFYHNIFINVLIIYDYTIIPNVMLMSMCHKLIPVIIT